MGFKRRINCYLPKEESFEKAHPFFKKHILKPQYWHFNRRSVAKGTGAGLFMAFVPLPFVQIIFAALFAVALRGNIAIAAMMTLLTNPFTFIPINLFTFKVGEWVLGNEQAAPLIEAFKIDDLSFSHLPATALHWLGNLGKAFFIGLPIVATTAAVFGFILVNCCWRLSVRLRWQKRLKSKHGL